MHLDALRDLKNVNTHLVAAAAYPVLENIGELLPSRIRQDDEEQSLMTHRVRSVQRARQLGALPWRIGERACVRFCC